MNKIDVIVPTKNSEKPCLRESLESIRDSDIPLNRLIVIDNFSSDNTVEIAKEFTDKIIQEDANLAKVREMGIKMVETDWFAFIDSDVIIPQNWFSEIVEYKEYGNALESWNWDWGVTDKFQGKKTKKGKKFTTSYRRQSDRARTIATLIETKYVKGIEIPKELSILEDEYIRRYLERNEGIWVKTGVKVDHYPPKNCAGSASPYKFGYLYGKYRFHSFSKLLLKALGNMIIKKKPYSYYWKMALGFLKGKFS